MAKKIEREIEEVLQQLDHFVPEGPAAPPPPLETDVPPAEPGPWSRKLASVSLGQVRLWSLGLVMAAFVFRPIPGASWVMLAGLLVFAAACAISISTAGTSTPVSHNTAPPAHGQHPGWLKGLKSLLTGR